SLGVETVPPQSPSSSHKEVNFSIGFKDLNESLNALEDNDLDALMADLVADINETEENLTGQRQASHDSLPPPPPPEQQHRSAATAPASFPPPPHSLPSARPPGPSSQPLPPPEPPKPLTKEEIEVQAKADKIKLALEKLKEAKVKKLVIKVIMTDGSSKTLMVDETQTVRDILDNLFEKTHCDCNTDWCLYECNPDLQIERGFEDHENVVELLSQWTRDSENKILFIESKDKYAVFKNPQDFYLGNKGKKNEQREMKDKDKESLLEESFCGTSIIVPDLEGALYLKEDGKKSWKRRYFLLRASGIYYVPKGKTKTSRDLACFIQFDNVNIYYGTEYKVKYKAPTDYCFVLKHPQIQKESQYIKYLCCDDKYMMHQWVTAIRIAKYGKTLYDNYKVAVQRAGLASRWSNLAAANTTKSSGPPRAKVAIEANGHAAQAPAHTTLSKAFPEAWKQAEAKVGFSVQNYIQYDNARDRANDPSLLPPPPEEFLPPPPPDPVPPPPPQPCLIAAPRMAPPHGQPICFPPPPPAEDQSLPPPSDDLPEPPPDFLPPPPPAAPAPRKVAPQPPKRTTPVSAGGGQGDFMSELMKAMQKKSNK
ncbi:AB1IP protein, partial [Atractosteus spatula]|nr:AB1IP protein [Atractosteus spatula]